MIPKVNKGESIQADHTNSMIDAINGNIPNSGANTILTSGQGGFSISTTPDVTSNSTNSYENAFHLGFIEDSNGALKAYVCASYIILDNKLVIPTLDDVDIAEEEPTEDFETPTKALSNGEWEFWLELDKLEYKARVHLEKKADIDQEATTNKSHTEWRNYGKFTIADGKLESYTPYIKQGQSESNKVNLCWTPSFFKTGETAYKFETAKGYVVNFNTGEVIEVDSEEFTPTTDDVYYCKILTDYDGVITSTSIGLESSPVNIEYDESTNGEYYFKLFTIKGNGTTTPWHFEQVIHTAIHFQKAGSGGSSFTPFALTTSTINSSHFFKVSSILSSITDGTNGSAIDLTSANLDTDIPISSTKYIVLEATVTSLDAISWDVVAVDLADSHEVGIDTSTPPEQDFVRLRVGKVTIAGGIATATQFSDDCKILSHMFLNGKIVLGLSSHPYNDY